MFYFLSEFRDLFFGFNIFRYITFRTAMAAVTAFVLSLILGHLLIRRFKAARIEERVKNEDCPQLDPMTHKKEGTPTMGGLFMIGSILISVFLWADLSNRYVLLSILTTLWLAILGGVDDYVKLTQKGKKRGLSARTKIFWQILLGILVGFLLYQASTPHSRVDVPLFKQFVVDFGPFYILWVMLIIVGASNAVNLTDGLDGLAIGCVLMVAVTLAVLSYITGHLKFSEYLLISYVPGVGELTVFCAAMMGASLGFLWFNCYPASIFMGDIGSLALGGSLGLIAVLIKKEFLLVLLGGIFVVEALSVILQVLSFKTTGKRIFKMAPLHHHFQLLGWSESKIIIRFWIIAFVLALLTLTTLKIR